MPAPTSGDAKGGFGGSARGDSADGGGGLRRKSKGGKRSEDARGKGSSRYLFARCPPSTNAMTSWWRSLRPPGKTLLYGVFAEIQRFRYRFDRLLFSVKQDQRFPIVFQECLLDRAPEDRLFFAGDDPIRWQCISVADVSATESSDSAAWLGSVPCLRRRLLIAKRAMPRATRVICRVPGVAGAVSRR